MDVEEEIEELRDLVEKNIEVTQDTNRVVRKMRRAAMWSTVFRVLWWLIIVGATGASYYYIVQPQVAKLEKLYGISQEETHGFNDQVVNLVKYITQHATSTKP